MAEFVAILACIGLPVQQERQDCSTVSFPNETQLLHEISMRCSRYGNGGRMHVTINCEQLEEMDCFKRLGTQVVADGCGTHNEWGLQSVGCVENYLV